MIEYLVAARAAIILWTNLAVMPVEIVFDAIEAELRRRGVEPQGPVGGHSLCKPCGTAWLSDRNRSERPVSREQSWSTQ
jgi:hypothetical protein